MAQPRVGGTRSGSVRRSRVVDSEHRFLSSTVGAHQRASRVAFQQVHVIYILLLDADVRLLIPYAPVVVISNFHATPHQVVGLDGMFGFGVSRVLVIVYESPYGQPPTHYLALRTYSGLVALGTDGDRTRCCFG